MSLTTLLLAFLPAAIVRAKPQPEKSDRETELEAELKRARHDLDVMRTELDRALARKDERDEAWRQLALARPPLMQNPLALLGLQNQQAAQQQLMAAQYQMQAAMNAQNFALGGLGDVCHCIPARHEALLGIIRD